MRLAIRVLSLLVAVELLAAGVWLGERLARPQFPPHTAEIVGPAASTALNHLWETKSTDKAADWQALAEAYLAHGSYRQAEACCRRADELERSTSNTYGWGICLSRLGRTSEANPKFRRIVESASGSMRSEAWYRIGRNMLRDENAAEAERAFRSTPDFPPALYQLTRLLLRDGRNEEAETIVRRLLEQNPDVIDLYQLAADCALSRGNRAEAREFLDRMQRANGRIALNRTVALFRQIRRGYGAARQLAEANALEKSGRTAAAAGRYRQALDAESPESLVLKVAQLEIESGRPQLALTLIEQQIERSGASPLLLERAGDAHLALKRDEPARQAWERAAHLTVRRQLFDRLADLTERLDDEAASARYRALALYAAGVESFRKNRLNDAFEQLSRSLELRADHAPAWFYLGEIHALENRPEEAAEAYRRCLAIDPGHGRAFAAQRRLESSLAPRRSR